MSNRPNIVLFFTDDQRFDTIQALGNSEIITPNIDRLVEMGTTFTHAHIPSGTSGAICMPSRAMLHTGRTLFHLEGEGQSIPEEHTMMGEAFQQAGYRTSGTGKWHNGTKAYARSFTDGGEIYFGGMWDHWNVPASSFDPSGKYDKQIPWIKDAFRNNHVQTVIADHIQIGKHSSELFADVSIDFINNYDADDPFFMYLSFMAPHDPRSMPEKFQNMYDPEKITLPENYCNEHPFEFGVRNIRDEVLAPYPRTPEIVKQHIAEYYAMITHLDHEIGRVLQALEENGQFENTIFVFAGDNGLGVGQHGLFGKQNHYEHSIRVPLIFAGPCIPKNERRDSFAYLLDIYPTLCDLLKIETPQSVDGISLLPAINDESIKARDTLYFAYNDLIRSIRDDRYKLIEYIYEDNHHVQLFDAIEDPSEINDLSNNSDYAEKIKPLREKMVEFRDEWDERDHRYGKSWWEKREALG